MARSYSDPIPLVGDRVSSSSSRKGLPAGPESEVPVPNHPVSRTVDLDGPVHAVDHGGPSVPGRPTVVCVHGLGGSHANWHDLAPLLARTHRVLALDLAGHGRTPRAGRSSSVRANRVLLDRFVDEVVGEPVVLLGNSMGAAISVLQAAAEPAKVLGLVLIGPALPRTRRDVPDRALARQAALYAVPGLAGRSLSRRRERLGPEGMVQETLELTTADATRVSPSMKALAVELLASRASGPDAEAAFLEAARSLGVLLARAGTYRAAIASVRAPALVLQGALDRLAPLSGVQQLAALQPGWQVEVLDGVGHVPQIEVPERTASLVLPFLESLPATPRTAPDDLLAGAS
ncbi:MAG: alpha/beta hydrolase fold [Frankiales bacterium]|nr:alpha/beta hydrolase fold [Frankiales bacterium]